MKNSNSPGGGAQAADDLFRSLATRRGFLKVGGGGLLAGAGLLSAPALLARAAGNDGVTDILTVARTAEQLAVTFYTNGLAHLDDLQEDHDDLIDVTSFAIEEQIHLNFFTAAGGGSLADTFSFPKGADTFTDLLTFIATQQLLEGAFDAAFTAAVKEFCELGHADLAQIACQIAMVEEGHRVLGRDILDDPRAEPHEEWAFAPTLLDKVADAPGVLAKAGFLSPTEGNSYKYRAVDFNDPKYARVYAAISNKRPDEKTPPDTFGVY